MATKNAAVNQSEDVLLVKVNCRLIEELDAATEDDDYVPRADVARFINRVIREFRQVAPPDFKTGDQIDE